MLQIRKVAKHVYEKIFLEDSEMEVDEEEAILVRLSTNWNNLRMIIWTNEKFRLKFNNFDWTHYILVCECSELI